jgi:carbon storage regulator
MLVLSRKIGEQTVVPQYKLVVTVVSTKGNIVRLGISAPDDVGVYREEIWHRLRQQAHYPQPEIGPRASDP